MGVRKRKTEMGNAVGSIVKQWISESEYNQKDLAEKAGISPASLCKFLSADSDLPFPRFLQIVSILRPPQNEIDLAFENYLDELNIPHGVIQLLRHGRINAPSIREQIHALIDMTPEDKLSPLVPILKMMGRPVMNDILCSNLRNSEKTAHPVKNRL